MPIDWPERKRSFNITEAIRRPSLSAIPVSRFGKYNLIGKLGQGGMAEVFLAYVAGPAGFRKLTVIKRLHDHLIDEPGFLEMFLDEARLAARLNHPNVVQTHEVDEVDGQFFLAMEYLDGQPLDRLRKRCAIQDNTTPNRVAARIVSEALDGLAYAHQLKDYDGTPLNVVHRDISPHNVFVTYEGVVKLLDFGIAKASTHVSETQAGVVKGKLAYIAPEQGRGYPIDQRADLWSMGVVLWETLASRRLFKGANDRATLSATLLGPIPSLRELDIEIPEPLIEICEKALYRDPSRRYQTALEMKADLERFLLADQGANSRKETSEFLKVIFEDVIEQHQSILNRCLSDSTQSIDVGGSLLGGRPETPSGIRFSPKHDSEDETPSDVSYPSDELPQRPGTPPISAASSSKPRPGTVPIGKRPVQQPRPGTEPIGDGPSSKPRPGTVPIGDVPGGSDHQTGSRGGSSRFQSPSHPGKAASSKAEPHFESSLWSPESQDRSSHSGRRSPEVLLESDYGSQTPLSDPAISPRPDFRSQTPHSSPSISPPSELGSQTPVSDPTISPTSDFRDGFGEEDEEDLTPTSARIGPLEIEDLEIPEAPPPTGPADLYEPLSGMTPLTHVRPSLWTPGRVAMSAVILVLVLFSSCLLVKLLNRVPLPVAAEAPVALTPSGGEQRTSEAHEPPPSEPPVQHIGETPDQVAPPEPIPEPEPLPPAVTKTPRSRPTIATKAPRGPRSGGAPLKRSSSGESNPARNRGTQTPPTPAKAPEPRQPSIGPAEPIAEVEQFGFMSLDTIPWSRVTLRGRVLGTTPLLRVRLPVGTHVLGLTNPEAGITTTYRVTIRSGETTARRLGLE